MSPATSRPTVAYFDMNVWVALAKGLKANDPAWQRRFVALTDAVDRGRAVIVLSSAHYLELWHRRDRTSREDIGRLMERLSGYTALAPIQRVLRLEIEAFVARHIGVKQRVEVEQVIGHGASHAFDSPFGRFRFVESLASADGLTAEGAQVDPPEEFVGVSLRGPKWEWLQLGRVSQTCGVGSRIVV